MKTKNTIFIAIIIAIMLIGTLNMGIMTASAKSEMVSTSPIIPITPLDAPDGPSILVTSSVRINSNGDLAGAASYGTGIWNDPYVLIVDIDAEGTNCGLFVGNTTSFMRIENSTINGTDQAHSFPWNVSAGIHLYNVRNANITNCTIYDIQTYGIYLSNNSRNISIYDNTIWECERGIAVSDTDGIEPIDCIYTSNVIYGNGTMVFGMSFDILSDNTTIENNVIENVALVGIGFNDSWDANIINNVISGNSFAISFGIIAYNSRYVDTFNNEIFDFGVGIMLIAGASGDEFDLDSDIIYDCDEGFNISGSSVVSITDAQVGPITTNGISISAGADQIDIVSCRFNDSTTGIMSMDSTNLTIESCEFTTITYGIDLYNTSDAQIDDSTFDDIFVAVSITLNCTEFGIYNCTADTIGIFMYGSDSSEITIVYCTITNVGTGIMLTNVTEVGFIYVLIDTTTNVGIQLDNSSFIVIYLCNVSNSGTLGGIYVTYSDTVILMNNSFATSDVYHVTFLNVTNATCVANYFYTADNGDAYDDGINDWSNVTYGGNYWCNYTGHDTDNDGYGETPYNITGGTNQDLYPIAEYVIDSTNVGSVMYDLMVAVMPIMIMIMMMGVILKSINKTIKKE